VSDVSAWVSLGVVGTSFVVVSGIALHLLRIGYRSGIEFVPGWNPGMGVSKRPNPGLHPGYNIAT